MGSSVLCGFAESVAVRSVVLASSDVVLRERLRRSLSGLRWEVRVAGGGAEAMAMLEDASAEALLMDGWLPDLEVGEFAGQVRERFPAMDVMELDGTSREQGTARSPRRNELLHALRTAQETPLTDTAVWNAAVSEVPRMGARPAVKAEQSFAAVGRKAPAARECRVADRAVATAPLLPELVGQSGIMRELAKLIHLVAPRTATVLVEGETGTGKEVVAKAIHRLSGRAAMPFVVLNCAAIPEALLEAELFGHTRGAFTGAVQARMGRIEAANGGTLFLDEIGEMPLALQAKMLRFLECGELQRVGDNDPVRVNVRIVAATHQPLEQRAEEGSFRLDLYHRLAVFPIEVPALRERMDDIELLAEHILQQMGKVEPRKTLSKAAAARLREHTWPGNVRELMHVIERASILSGDQVEIGAEAIRFRRATR